MKPPLVPIHSLPVTPPHPLPRVPPLPPWPPDLCPPSQHIPWCAQDILGIPYRQGVIPASPNHVTMEDCASNRLILSGLARDSRASVPHYMLAKGVRTDSIPV